MKNYNLNRNRSSDFGFQKCFSRNFQFHRRDPNRHRIFSYVAPNYEYEVMSNLQSRWMERNVEMGDDRDATKVNGPDIVEYKKCKEAFEKA